MAWVRGEPEDTTKIRDLGTVIRPNFQAIDSGDPSFKPIAINLSDRDADPLSGSSDPTPITDAYLIYCKQDTAADPQLYGVDPSNNKIQFTGFVPSLMGNGYVFLPGNILLQWLTSTSADNASINFPKVFGSAPWCITGNEITNNLSDYDSVKPVIVDATSFTLRLVRGDGNPQTNAKACNFIAIGQAI